MDFYTAHLIALLEREQRIRSLPKVPEYDTPMRVRQPRWVWRLALRLMYALGNGLVTMGKRMTQGQNIAIDAPLVEPKSREVPV